MCRNRQMSRRSSGKWAGASPRSFRVAVSSHLNAQPLVSRLADADRVDLIRTVPSEMGGLLASGAADAALLPSIELQRLEIPLKVVPAGCIAASRPALMARLYTQCAAEEVEVVWTDTEAPSALTLTKVLWAENYGIRPHVIPFDPSRDHPPDDAHAVLLTGDYVINRPPITCQRQFDLAAMWYEMTGVPFVFSVWAIHADAVCRGLYKVLDDARVRETGELESLARHWAPLHGWPEDLAVRCLTGSLEFELGDDQKDGLEEFFTLAEEYKLIDACRPVRYCKM